MVLPVTEAQGKARGSAPISTPIDSAAEEDDAAERRAEVASGKTRAVAPVSIRFHAAADAGGEARGSAPNSIPVAEAAEDDAAERGAAVASGKARTVAPISIRFHAAPKAHGEARGYARTSSSNPFAVAAEDDGAKGRAADASGKGRGAAPTSAYIPAASFVTQPRVADASSKARAAAPISIRIHAEVETDGAPRRVMDAGGVARGAAPTSTSACIPAATNTEVLQGDRSSSRSRAPCTAKSAHTAEPGRRSFLWCRENFENLVKLPSRAKVSSKVSSIFDEDDEENENEDPVFYCLPCGVTVEKEHEAATGHEHDTVRVDFRQGRPFLSVNGDEPWNYFLNGLESLSVEDGARRLIALRPPSGRRCLACADMLVDTDCALFCTFQCRVRSGEAAGHTWSRYLLLEEFSVPCDQMDRVCRVFPSELYCARCCGSHHLCPPGTASTPGLVGGGNGCLVDSLGRTVVRHVTDPDAAGICTGVCALCNAVVESPDHGCLHGLPTTDDRDDFFSKPKEHVRDAFCFDCTRAFSTAVCIHHRDHMWLRVCLHNGQHCLLLPEEVVTSWNLTGLDAIQYFSAAEAPGHRIVPLRCRTTTRCRRCQKTVSHTNTECSLRCRLKHCFD